MQLAQCGELQTADRNTLFNNITVTFSFTSANCHLPFLPYFPFSLPPSRNPLSFSYKLNLIHPSTSSFSFHSMPSTVSHLVSSSPFLFFCRCSKACNWLVYGEWGKKKESSRDSGLSEPVGCYVIIGDQFFSPVRLSGNISLTRQSYGINMINFPFGDET